MRNRTLAVLGAAAAAAAVLALAVGPDGRESPPQGVGAPLFPALSAAVNDVARVELSGAGGRTTLIRGDDGRWAGRWVVAERDSYPAGLDAVKNLVVGLAAASLTEPRTASPELYPRIGVEEPEGDGATGVRVVLRRADGGELAAAIIGKPANPSSIGAGPGQVYLRRVGEAQSWLATTPLDPIRADPVHWLERALPRPIRDHVVSLEVREPSGATLTLKRGQGADEKTFFAEGLPAGATLDELAAEEATGALAFLSFEDVGAHDPFLFSMAPLYVYKTRDGGTIRARVARRDGVAWLEIAAEGMATDFSHVAGRAFRIHDATAETLSRPVDGYAAAAKPPG